MHRPDKKDISITGKPQANSLICQFTVSYPLLPGGKIRCESKEEARGSPLLEALFEIEGVERVLIENFSLTLAKSSDRPWREVGREVAAAVREIISSYEAFIATHRAKREEPEEEKNPNLKKPEAVMIQRLLNEEINPWVAMHGGHIALKELEDRTAYIELSGGCKGCGASEQTVKAMVASTIQEAISGVDQVLDVTDHASGTNPYFKEPVSAERYQPPTAAD